MRAARFAAAPLRCRPELEFGSLLPRLIGRTEDAVIVRSAEGVAGCFVGCGGFLFEMEGDADTF